MPQRQYDNYKADITSFELREAMLGILGPGRYSGFSAIAANGSPSGGNIPLTISHTGGVQKLAKGGSSLSNSIGVAITTQGVVIHEDGNLNVTVTDNSGGASAKYSLVYMEHTYLDGVIGANPATYGVINGTAGGGIPTLTDAYKRIVLGVVEMAAGATTISNLTWHPRPSENIFGDTQLLQALFGADANYQKSKMGTIPALGVISHRIYDEENFVTNLESITASINALDIALKLASDLATEVDGRALDSADWAALSDNTNFNVSTTKHGFVPKLPNNSSLFLNGVGGFTDPGGLLAANNLSDLPNMATARNNLGVLSSIDLAAEYFDDTGWQAITRGTAAYSSNFDLQIRRIGKLCIIQGTFKDGADASTPNAVIGNILYTSIDKANLAVLKPSTNIRFSCGNNMFGYVAAYVNGDTFLYLKVESASGLSNNGTTKFNLNLSFFVD